MSAQHIKLSIVMGAFLVVGLIADLLPHPALGPGIIELSFQKAATMLQAEETVVGDSDSELGKSSLTAGQVPAEANSPDADLVN